jgi:hypothetical protein
VKQENILPTPFVTSVVTVAFLPSNYGSIRTPDFVIRFARARVGVYVRLSDICKDAPPDVLRALAWILVSRLLGKKVPTIHERVYRDYSLTPGVIARVRPGEDVDGDENIFRRLKVRFTTSIRCLPKLNRRFFNSEIPKPAITWSQRRTRSILGHHDHIYDSITISKTLDSKDVPRVVCRVHPVPRNVAHQTPGQVDSTVDVITTQVHFDRMSAAFPITSSRKSGLNNWLAYEECRAPEQLRLQL